MVHFVWGSISLIYSVEFIHHHHYHYHHHSHHHVQEKEA